ncbi:hypothetical protein NFI96_000180, partial [Prochilodus magdalenae]
TTEVQMEKAAVELFPTPMTSRPQSSSIYREYLFGEWLTLPSYLLSMCHEAYYNLCSAVGKVIAALGLGLVAGAAAGGCLGATAAEMVYLLNGTTVIQTKLKVKRITRDPNCCLKSTAYVTYIYLLVAMTASAAGVLYGQQVYYLIKRQRWGGTPGKAFALAAPAGLLGMAVTAVALGAVAEKFVLFLGFPFIPVDILGLSISSQMYAMMILFCLLLIVNHTYVFTGLLVALLLLGTSLFHTMTSLSGFVPLLDIDSIFPLFFTSLLISNKTPRIVTTLLFIAMSVLPYHRDEPVPLDTARVKAPITHVLKRLFVIRLGIQMFQASCGAVLFSHFVTSGAGKVCIGAVAATAGVLAALVAVSPMLGNGASLGGLLAASGAAGVALNAAGDLSQKDGGHAGMAGAVIGAAVGAFLPLATQEVKVGITVALCAAVIPGLPWILFGLDFLYHLHPWWHMAVMCAYVPDPRGFHLVIKKSQRPVRRLNTEVAYIQKLVQYRPDPIPAVTGAGGGMAEIRVQMEEPAGELVPRSLLSRLKSSYICRNVIGALGLGLVAGFSAGGCMGAMAAVMVRLMKERLEHPHTVPADGAVGVEVE